MVLTPKDLKEIDKTIDILRTLKDQMCKNMHTIKTVHKKLDNKYHKDLEVLYQEEDLSLDVFLDKLLEIYNDK